MENEHGFIIPGNIKSLISGREYTTDDTGMSGSCIMIFDALGIEPDRDKIDYFILLDELF
ncbi:MAG: hypothetical protein IKH20_00680 [Clostridiales bacterium]|nr:hypothetical protein [Clostridiales bacterium]